MEEKTIKRGIMVKCNWTEDECKAFLESGKPIAESDGAFTTWGVEYNNIEDLRAIVQDHKNKTNT